jgi:glycosyltransferase involved in cell wall biosynthesis
MKVLIVGPFPPVINGVTVCNDYLKKKLGEKYLVETINTDSGIISTNQGDSLSFKKVFSFIQIYFFLFKVFKTNVAYFTPGQTFWGLSKYLPFSLLCICLRKKYILHLHGGYTAKAYGNLQGIKKYIFKSIIINASSVICLSESLAREMKSKLPQAKVDVVENFFDPVLIENTPLVKDSSHLRIVYLSNLMKEKGILELLEAAIVLNNKEIDFELHIAGKLEQEISSEVYFRIEQLGEKVTFYGNLNLEGKKELLQKTNVFVLPTYYTMEGQPISIIEAYVTSNVVITTDQGGIMDIAGYPSVILVNKKDAADLAEKLMYVEKHLEELLRKADQTRMDSQIRFDSKRFVAEIESIMLQYK